MTNILKLRKYYDCIFIIYQPSHLLIDKIILKIEKIVLSELWPLINQINIFHSY